jgi:hypothetical protein
MTMARCAGKTAATSRTEHVRTASCSTPSSPSCFYSNYVFLQLQLQITNSIWKKPFFQGLFARGRQTPPFSTSLSTAFSSSTYISETTTTGGMRFCQKNAIFGTVRRIQFHNWGWNSRKVFSVLLWKVKAEKLLNRGIEILENSQSNMIY